MVRHQNIQPPKMFYGFRDQRPRRFGTVEIRCDCIAHRITAFFRQCFGLPSRAAVAEHNLRARCREQANRSRANAARAAGDERDFSFQ